MGTTYVGEVRLTFDQAVADLRRIVEERGDNYVYDQPVDGCVYFEPEYGDNGIEKAVPSCAVGQLLAIEGIDGLDLMNDGLNDETGVLALFKEGVIKSDDPRVERLLWVMQIRQDGCRPYGECLRHAIVAAEHVDLPEPEPFALNG